MKRPDIETIFGPVNISLTDAASRVLDLLLDKFEDSYFSSYYAKMMFDPGENTFYFWDEEMNLRGRKDLLQRIERDRGGRWSCDVNMGFAPGAVYPAIFVDPPNGSEITVQVTIDPAVTRFLEEIEESRVPFVLFLVRIAKTIGAKWFLTGLDLEHWRRLPASQIMDRELFPPGTYVVCWKDDALDEEELLRGLSLRAEDVMRSTLGYRFVTFFPEV